MLLGVGWLYVLLLMHQSGIARASDVLEQSESIADILSNTHTAVFLVGMHGMVHTDEIGMHTVLYSLQRAPRRDARQPCPARPAHLPPTASCEAPKAARCASSSRGRRETWWRCDSCTAHPLRRGAHHRASRRGARSEGGLHACPRQSA